MIDTTYQRTIDDLLAFQMHFLQRNPTYRRNRLIGWVLGPVFFFVLGGAVATSHSIRNADVLAVLWVVGGLVYAVVYRPFYDWYVKRTARRMFRETGTRGVIGEVNNTLSTENITEVVDEIKNEIAWRNTERIDETPLHTFLFMTPMSAVIWPRHGFRTEDEYEKVVAFAKERFAHFHGHT